MILPKEVFFILQSLIHIQGQKPIIIPMARAIRQTLVLKLLLTA